MHTVEFVRSEDGDWTDLYVNGAHAAGGHSLPDWLVVEALVECAGLAVEVSSVEVSVDELFRRRDLAMPTQGHNKTNDA